MISSIHGTIAYVHLNPDNRTKTVKYTSRTFTWSRGKWNRKLPSASFGTRRSSAACQRSPVDSWSLWQHNTLTALRVKIKFSLHRQKSQAKLGHDH